MELIYGLDVNFVMPCMLRGHVSQGPFHSYGVHRRLVNRAGNDVLHKNKEKLFSIYPAPTSESPRQDHCKVLPTPGPKWLDLCLWLPGGPVTGHTNWTVHLWQFISIRGPFSLASSRCVHPLSYNCFRFLLKSSALRKFTVVGFDNQ